MWINQPSTFQPLHALHGQNVLACREDGDTWRIYFTAGPVISQRAASTARSPGWR